jgi:predicted metal-dependent hydrolase
MLYGAAPTAAQRASVRRAIRTLGLAAGVTVSDGELPQRASALSARYFRGAVPVRAARWGAITEHSAPSMLDNWGAWRDGGEITVSERAQHLDPRIIDGIVVHELAHHFSSRHGPGFWHQAHRYPHTKFVLEYLAVLSRDMDRAGSALADSLRTAAGPR